MRGSTAELLRKKCGMSFNAEIRKMLTRERGTVAGFETKCVAVVAACQRG